MKLKGFLAAMIFGLTLVSCDMLNSLNHDDDDDDHQALFNSLSTGIQAYLTANYDGYEVEEVENDTLCDGTTAGTEIELEGTGDNEVELFFDANDSLIYVAVEMNPNNLPQQAVSLITTNYPSYTIDDEAVIMTFTNGSVWYEVEIEDESADSELELTISDEWSIICVEVEED